MTLPSHARIVVIGGGIIGCSTAYHLARDHRAEVLLLEQGRLTSGSTWHAAGLVGQLRSSAGVTRVLKYSVDLYKGLAAETGLETGWKMTGCLRLATNADRWTEYRRLATTAKSFGMEMHLVDPAEVKRGIDDNGGPENIILARYAPDPSYAGKSLAQLYAELPVTHATLTMGPHCGDTIKYGVVDELVARFKAMHANGESVTGQKIVEVLTVNGVRFTTEDGTWGLIRASSNKPQLVVVAESPVSKARMCAMYRYLKDLLDADARIGAWDQTMDATCQNCH